VIHSPSFDLKLLHFSLLTEIVAYTAMAFSVRPLPFTVFAVLGSFGAGFSPALQSVALALYTRAGGTEVGRLFGALSVIQALGMQIFGPSLYGLIYVKTVAIFPRAIFFVSVFSVVVAYIFMNLVRLPKDHELKRQSTVDLEEEASALESAHVHAQEETLVGAGDFAGVSASSRNGGEHDQQKRLVDTSTTSYGTSGGKPHVG
jgi:MFS family permease